MVQLPVYNKSGEKVDVLSVDLESLSPPLNRQLLHDVVVMYRNAARQGTRGTRSRGEVAGSTKKMYRQKGTGRARAGSRRSVIRRGGGHAFALKTRDTRYRLPRKAVRAATRMAVVGKIRDHQVLVIDELSLAAPKTRDMAAILRALQLDGKSTLIATAAHDPLVYRSARNIDRVQVSPVSGLNALAVLEPQRLLFTRAALTAFAESAGGGRTQESQS